MTYGNIGTLLRNRDLEDCAACLSPVFGQWTAAASLRVLCLPVPSRVKVADSGVLAGRLTKVKKEAQDFLPRRTLGQSSVCLKPKRPISGASGD